MKTLSARAVEAVVSVKIAANEIAFNMLLLLCDCGVLAETTMIHTLASTMLRNTCS